MSGPRTYPVRRRGGLERAQKLGLYAFLILSALFFSIPLFIMISTSLKTAAAALEAQHRGLDVALRLAPAMGFDPEGAEADAAIAAIAESGARVVFLALGAPKQERFAARAQKALPGVGFLSIGAGLDFVSGAQRRAPRLLRNLAGEWLWRLAGNPTRLGRRYAACAAILPGLTLRAVGARRRMSS